MRITHLPTGLVVEIQDEKSQHKNKAKAMAVLRARLLELEQRKAHEAEAAARRAHGRLGRAVGEDPDLQLPAGPASPTTASAWTCTTCPACSTATSTACIDALITTDQAERLADLDGPSSHDPIGHGGDDGLEATVHGCGASTPGTAVEPGITGAARDIFDGCPTLEPADPARHRPHRRPASSSTTTVPADRRVR